MKKLIQATCVALYLLCPFNAFSQTLYLGGYHFSVDIAPEEYKTFKNPLFWSASGHCQFHFSDATQVILEVELISHSASVDGQRLEKHHPVDIPLSDNQDLSLKADAWAEVNLHNKSHVKIHADCS